MKRWTLPLLTLALIVITPPTRAQTLQLERDITQAMLELDSIRPTPCTDALLADDGVHLCGLYQPGSLSFTHLWDEHVAQSSVLARGSASSWRHYPDGTLLRVHRFPDDAYLFVEIKPSGLFIVSLYSGPPQ